MQSAKTSNSHYVSGNKYHMYFKKVLTGRSLFIAVLQNKSVLTGVKVKKKKIKKKT